MQLDKNGKLKEKRGFLWHCSIMFFLVILVYWQYLTGQKVYVFTDVASDSAGQTYPNLIYLAREYCSDDTAHPCESRGFFWRRPCGVSYGLQYGCKGLSIRALFLSVSKENENL